MIPQAPLPAADLPDDDRHPLLKSNRRYFSPKELADITDMSTAWVYRQIDLGNIRAGRVGARIKIPRSEAERLDENLRAQIEESEGDGTIR
jgi:excisionase family DNA binding protein